MQIYRGGGAAGGRGTQIYVLQIDFSSMVEDDCSGKFAHLGMCMSRVHRRTPIVLYLPRTLYYIVSWYMVCQGTSSHTEAVV